LVSVKRQRKRLNLEFSGKNGSNAKRRLTDRHEPKQWVFAKYVAHILAEASIVRLLHMERNVFFILLLTELDGGVCRDHEIHVESEKQSDQDGDGGTQNVRGHNEVRNFVVEAGWAADRALQDRVRRPDDSPGCCHAVENHA